MRIGWLAVAGGLLWPSACAPGLQQIRAESLPAARRLAQAIADPGNTVAVAGYLRANTHLRGEGCRALTPRGVVALPLGPLLQTHDGYRRLPPPAAPRIKAVEVLRQLRRMIGEQASGRAAITLTRGCYPRVARAWLIARDDLEAKPALRLALDAAFRSHQPALALRQLSASWRDVVEPRCAVRLAGQWRPASQHTVADPRYRAFLDLVAGRIPSLRSDGQLPPPHDAALVAALRQGRAHGSRMALSPGCYLALSKSLPRVRDRAASAKRRGVQERAVIAAVQRECGQQLLTQSSRCDAVSSPNNKAACRSACASAGKVARTAVVSKAAATCVDAYAKDGNAPLRCEIAAAAPRTLSKKTAGETREACAAACKTGRKQHDAKSEAMWQAADKARCKRPKRSSDCDAIAAYVARGGTLQHQAEARRLLRRVALKLKIFKEIEAAAKQKEKKKCDDLAAHIRRYNGVCSKTCQSLWPDTKPGAAGERRICLQRCAKCVSILGVKP